MAIDLHKILQQLDQRQTDTLPPVQSWQPSIIGEMDLVIDKQQKWFHEGDPFKRDDLVKLLSSVMRVDDAEYFLVTPSEKMKIQVEDVPFAIVSVINSDKNAPIRLLTNTEQLIPLDHECDWELRTFEGIQLPYVRVRADLWARVNRAVFYQLVELAELDEDNEMLIHSAGKTFSLGKISDNSL